MVATTRKMLGDWFDRGVEQGSEFMVIKSDWFDGESYPHYCGSRTDAEVAVATSGNGQDRVIEIYDLTAERGPQLNTQRRVWALNANDPAVVRKAPVLRPATPTEAQAELRAKQLARPSRPSREDALVRQLADKLGGSPSSSGPDTVVLRQDVVDIQRRLLAQALKLEEAEKRIAKLEKKLKKLAD